MLNHLIFQISPNQCADVESAPYASDYPMRPKRQQ